MPDPLLVCVGSYASADQPGIRLLRLDPDSGALTPAGSASGVTNPSFLAVHPDGTSLYAVEEVGSRPDDASGRVHAFALDAQAATLTHLGDRSSLGASPCHLAVDRSGRHVLVANYHSGSVAMLPLGRGGGFGPGGITLRHRGLGFIDEDSGEHDARQDGPHVHAVAIDRGDRFALVADLGLDRIFVYRFDAQAGTLAAHDPASVEMPHGSGPRQLAWSPTGTRLYAINELTSTLTAFSFDAGLGRLHAFQTISTRPAGAVGENWASQLAVSADGRFLYASNRGDDALAIVAIDAGSGGLIPRGHRPSAGKCPRHFALDPSGRWLLIANQHSDTVVVLPVDRHTGALGDVAATATIPKPTCICPVPQGD